MGADALWPFIEAARAVPVYLLDEAGTIIGWTAGAERIFGYLPAEARGLPLFRLYPRGPRAEQMADDDLRAAAAAGCVRGEVEMCGKADVVVRMERVIEVIREPGGNVAGFHVSMFDSRPAQPAAPDRRLHELNNRLAAILGSAEVLARQLKARPDLAQLCEVIGDSAVSAGEVVRSLAKTAGR